MFFESVENEDGIGTIFLFIWTMIRVELFSIQMTSLGRKDWGPMKISGELGCRCLDVGALEVTLLKNPLMLDDLSSVEDSRLL